jgi:hypothetical protein
MSLGASPFLAGTLFFSLTPDFSRVAAGGVEANGFNRFRRRIAAGLGQAVETAWVCATLATGLKPGVNEKLQKSEMRPMSFERTRSGFSSAVGAAFL